MKKLKPISILKNHFPDANPEIKIFFIRLVHSFELDETISLSVKDLSSKLGVSITVVSKAFQYLVNYCYLQRSSFRSEEGGNCNHYTFLFDDESQFLKINKLHHNKNIIDSSGEEPYEEGAINIILSNRYVSTNDKTKRGKNLNLSNRLLLSILIAFSDKSGVVRDIGISDFVLLTGMAKDRLASQIEKLMSLKFIRSNVAGVTGKYLFGVAKGAYYLDLCHPYIGLTSISRAIVCCDFVSFGELEHYTNEGSRIKSAARTISADRKEHNLNNLPFTWPAGYYRSMNLTQLDLFTEILRISFSQKSIHIEQYLQYKIYTYASIVLTKSLNELNISHDDSSHHIEEIVKNELLSTRCMKEAPFIDKEQVSYLFHTVINASVGLAILLKDLICDSSEDLLKQKYDSICIIPPLETRNVRRHLTIEFLSFKSKLPNKLYKITDIDKLELKVTTLSENELFQYGLATKVSTRNIVIKK